MDSETTGPREHDRALFALDGAYAPCFLVCVPARTHAYPAFPDSVWLCHPGGETLEAARAASARTNAGEWVLVIERVDVAGEDWPASDRPCVTDYLLREGSWVVLVPSARLVPSWISPGACLVVRVAHAGEEEDLARGELAAEPARALLGRVCTVESIEAGFVMRWLRKNATSIWGGWRD